MRRLLATFLSVTTMIVVTACGADDISDATWRLVSLEVDGEAVEIDQVLFLDTDDGEFSAETTCNRAFGKLGSGEIGSTAALCGDATIMQHEDWMIDALRLTPDQQDDRLVFDSGTERLVYERYEVPTIASSLSVLADRTGTADLSLLPSEQSTGSIPPTYDTLIPVTSPDARTDIFLASFQGNACVVVGTASTIDHACLAPRDVAVGTMSHRFPRQSEPLIRVALIPDRYLAAIADRPDLGTVETNVLFVADDAPLGRHVLADESGETFTLSVN